VRYFLAYLLNPAPPCRRFVCALVASYRGECFHDRPRAARRVVHLQLALRTDDGMRLAVIEYQHPVCTYVIQRLAWPMADGGEIVVTGSERLWVEARAWEGPAGAPPPLPWP
jgi:hypothetical protein